MNSSGREQQPKDTNDLNPTNDDIVAISRWLREVPPAHFTFKVKSFSTSLEKLDSDTFEAGGYKWRLSLYPKGNTDRNGNDHISLYLVIVDTKDLPCGWEVFVSFKLFVFDHINDKFLAIQDADKKVRRFRTEKTEWGFDQLLPLSTFNDVSNGYLDLDSCIFGAEVFIHEKTARAEFVSLVEPKGYTYTWKVDNFSKKLENEYIYSDEFTVGGLPWRICLNPEGYKREEKYLSLYLQIGDWVSEVPAQRVYAKYELRIRNQTSYSHAWKKYKSWFSVASRTCGGLKFLSLSHLNDPGMSYSWKNTVIVHVHIEVMALVKIFS